MFFWDQSAFKNAVHGELFKPKFKKAWTIKDCYHRKIWTRRHEFKSWTMITFSYITNNIGKGMNLIILLPDMGK